jgi:FMN reductase (NADPH)
MLTNPIIETMLKRKSVRKFTDQKPNDEMVRTIVRAGQQAPFAGQLCSLLLTRKKSPFNAALWFTICVDMHRMELIMAKREWNVVANDLAILLLGIQDAAYMAENMVIAAESFGMGSCFLGNTPYRAGSIRKKYKMPERVFPLVELVIGYPAEDCQPRPRYPLEFTLFEDEYPKMTDEMVERAMKIMDDGYLAQDYYRKQKAKIKLEGGRQETFTYDDYSWTEHISRKWGLWMDDPQELLDEMAKCGFEIQKKKSANQA